ncbi:MAG: hypothetical protein ABW352_08760 [Polyangiales bacterium]
MHALTIMLEDSAALQEHVRDASVMLGLVSTRLEPGKMARLDADKLLRQVDTARARGIEARLVILGPVSFLKLARLAPDAAGSTLDFLDTVLNSYAALLTLLREEGVHQVQLDEPCLALALSDADRHAYEAAFERLSTLTSRPRVVLATAHGALRENLPLAVRAGFEALHIELARG